MVLPCFAPPTSTSDAPHRVVAFEPVDKFRAFLEWSVHAAGVAELVYVVGLALSDTEGPLPLVLPRDGTYWGLASAHGVNVMVREGTETVLLLYCTAPPLRNRVSYKRTCKYTFGTFFIGN